MVLSFILHADREQAFAALGAEIESLAEFMLCFLLSALHFSNQA